MQNVERLLRCGDEHHLVATLLQERASRVGQSWIGFHAENFYAAGVLRICKVGFYGRLLKLNGYFTAKIRHQDVADALRSARQIDCVGRRPIRERDVQRLSNPVAAARCGYHKAAARGVDCFADVFKCVERANAAANVDASDNLGAKASAPVGSGTDWMLRAVSVRNFGGR